MYCNVTERLRAGMESMWEEAAVCSRLSEASTVREYLRVLRDSKNWNTLSFSLRRYIYLHFTGRERTEEPVPYTVSFDGQPFVFSPVSPEVEISDQEKQDYAELMYRMTLKNRCFFRNKKGVMDTKKGAISKQQYLNYLNDHRIYRKNLFPLSVALGFDVDTMTQFMSVLGESPVYNFRSAAECIYYFCHCVPSLNCQETVDELADRYRAIRLAAAPALPAGAGMTAQLGCAIDDIVYDEDLTDLERKEAFVEFLQENVSQFIQHSKTARELLAKELNSEQLLDTLPQKRIGHGKLSAVFIHPDDVECRLLDGPGVLGGGIYDDLFAARYRGRYGEALKVRELELDSRMTANLTDSAHLRSVFEEDLPAALQERVTKQDFLLVRLAKFCEWIKQERYTENERLELMRMFKSSTDRILLKAGLPKIYVANPMDHMVLTALAQKDPEQFTQELYCRAAEEDGP